MPPRGGRGGGRGRGGFRGGYGGGGPSMDGGALMQPPTEVGQLYPKRFDVGNAILSKATSREKNILELTRSLDKVLADGIVDPVSGSRWAGWRIPDPRKVVAIEIDDLNARPPPRSAYDPQTGLLAVSFNANGSGTTATGGNGNGGGGTNGFELEPDRLGLDQDFFPPALWEAYFQPEKVLAAKARVKMEARKRKRPDIDLDGEEVEEEDEADKDSNVSSGMRDDDFDDGRKTDDGDPDDNDAVDQDHQDYDANYFDNGEGDDDDDGGNGGE